MAKKLTVVMVEPHKVPYVAEIEDELSALQKAVGGYIEVVGNGDGTLIICNEEEKLEGLEGNRRIHDGASIIAGTFFVVGEDGENFRSLTDSETVKYMERFAEPEDISQDEVESDIIIIVVMPIVAVVSIFNGNIEIDTDRLQTMLVQNLSAEEKAKLQFVEDTMNSIDEKMKAAGFDGRVKEAQVLYVLALSDSSHDPDFADKLVSCFQENQTDEQLIAAVNSAFGTQLTAEDFGKVMGNIRSLYIDISDYIDPKTKNNLDLVKWAKHAQENGWGYVWGSHGNLLDKTELERLESVFGSHVTDYDDFIRHNWIGKRTADCVGLIKGYGWYDTESGKITVGSNGMQDVTADGMFSAATEKDTIDTIPEIPGIAVWHEGHIGIYIGGGEVIHAANTKAGVIRTPIGQSGWTHWLKVPYIKYIEESEKSTS